ncbi:MAG TPA: tetratricopeptide repeat-containing protein kinase family protein, partial [Kofleriaceae bacterium]
DLRAPVTQTGAVLGTPAYMAPEQFAGAPVDARADQFAFCVTAWEALWGERPFAGESFVQLNVAISLGQRRPPPPVPRVPARVRAALERGLSVDPAERFPTMAALLDAIRPARRRWRRWGLAAAGVAIAGAAAAVVLWGRAAGPACDPGDLAGAAELAPLRGDLPERIARAGSPQIAARAEKLLADYTAGFGDFARRACRAERGHEWSPEIAAQSRRCFQVVARTAALSLAGVDPARPLDALRHLRRLPPEEHCANQSHLVSRPPIPADPARLAALTDATALLAVGFDSIEDHAAARLHQTLATLEASPARGEPGIAAGLTVLRGWRALDAGDVAEARRLFVEAYYAGRTTDDEQILGVALGLLIEYGADLGLEPAAVDDWLRTALADADRIRARSPWLAGRIYTVAARAADVANNAERALVFVARAREVLDPHDPSRIESYATEGSVLLWSGHVEDGIRAYEAAIAQRTAYAGADDPDLASLLSDYAGSLLQAERLGQAMQAADRAAAIIDHVVDPDDDRIDPIRLTLAGVLIGANQDDQALDLLDTARAHSVQRLGETSAIVASIDTNLATIYAARGEHDRALAALGSALAIDEKRLGPDRLEVATVLYNLAASHRARHDYPAAIAAARRAAAIYQARSPGSDRHRLALTMAALAANDARDFPQALALTAAALGFPRPAESPQTPAWAQLERARALIGIHRSADARPLLVAARKAYAELAMAPRVRQVDELLAQLPR